MVLNLLKIIHLILYSKSERIDEFLMIRVLCLMVYSSLQYLLRKKLKGNNEIIFSQVNKSTKILSMKLIYELLD